MISSQKLFKNLVKAGFRVAGFKIERIDPLEESIPADYNRSPFLPRVYRGSLDRMLYFLDQLDKVKGIEGDLVECGVSIGHGALLFTLIGEWLGKMRDYWGFDSFEGFPDPTLTDETTPITGKGFWASPPEVVYKVLHDGRLPESIIRERIHLVKGWFQDTLLNTRAASPCYTWTVTCMSPTRSLLKPYMRKWLRAGSSCSTNTTTGAGRGQPRPLTNSLPTNRKSRYRTRSAAGSILF